MAGKLTTSKLQSLKATGKDYKLCDGNGLYIRVDTKGNKTWQFRYKNKWEPLGSYPTISLKAAREEAFRAKQLLSNGKDPKIEREKQKYQDEYIFLNLATKAIESRHPTQPYGWDSEEVYKRNLSILNRLILPKLKTLNIKDIEPYQIAKVLEGNTPSNQNKMKNLFNLIFNYAIGKGLIKYNVARDIKVDKADTKGFEFIDPVEDKYHFSELLRDIDTYKGQYNISMALRLAVLVGFRPRNIVELKWENIKSVKQDGQEINFISIKAEDMKMKRDFRQPLSKQAYDLLMEIKEYNGGHAHVFHSTNSNTRYISKESLSKALRETLGYNGNSKPKQHTHGFRKSARTYISSIRSKYNWCDDAVRMILSHSKANSIDEIYDKNDFLIERAEMLQLWADYVDHIRVNSNVTKIDNVG
ncbi:tyrosine-type recombinase/integrase [Pseudofrancisella aestuarii]|uniref:Tyrosine-type recombinase/integrase n=1 Tax=Pseudofrancisella aestuarii TaxID=2670347 RepID=A0ABV9TCG6_9GAMM|nr:site-specific integrase [Pseudofrancisella aestuarii]